MDHAPKAYKAKLGENVSKSSDLGEFSIEWIVVRQPSELFYVDELSLSITKE